jgi:uncharacterized protein YndB with AHSA1/START domain
MENAGTKPEPKYETTAERVSDREMVVTRRFDAPARLVFQAWTRPELMMRWWLPKSFGMTFVECEMEARTGGRYRFVFGHPQFEHPMAFFGTYLEVVQDARIVWTNEESGEAGAVTTVTFEEAGGVTVMTLSDLCPSKEALDEAIASGSTGAWPEQLAELEAFLAG